MRNRFVCVLAFILVLASTGASLADPAKGSPGYKIRLVIAHDPAPPYYVRSMNHFAQKVAERTNGRVKVEVMTSSQFGTIDHNTIVNAVSSGKVEMSAATTVALGSVERDMLVFEMPYLFQSYKHVARTIDGPVGQQLLASLGKHNLKGLAFTYSGGFKIVASNKPIRTPGDFKSTTVLASDPVTRAMFRRMGAETMGGNPRSTSRLMSRHLVDAASMTYTRYEEWKVPSKYVNELDHSFFLTVLMMNDKFYKSLPAEYRAIVTRAANETALEERAQTIIENNAVRDRLASRGVKLVTLTPAEKQAFRTRTAPMYAEFGEQFFTRGLVERIRGSSVAVDH